MVGQFQKRRGPGSTRTPVRRSDAGFTLLEMLVAIAILATLIALIPRGFVSARAIMDRSEDWLASQLVAEAVLDGELSGSQLHPGVLQGTKAGRQWSATLRLNDNRFAAASKDGRVLLDVRVRVAVSPRRTLEVDTIRIGVAQ